MTYKTTGRDKDIEKITLVEEDIYAKPRLSLKPDSVSTTSSKKEHKKSDEDLKSRDHRFILESSKYGKYIEQGYLKYFLSRKSAKKTRNELNKKFGPSEFCIKKISVEELAKECFWF